MFVPLKGVSLTDTLDKSNTNNVCGGLTNRINNNLNI